MQRLYQAELPRCLRMLSVMGLYEMLLESLS